MISVGFCIFALALVVVRATGDKDTFAVLERLATELGTELDTVDFLHFYGHDNNMMTTADKNVVDVVTQALGDDVVVSVVGKSTVGPSTADNEVQVVDSGSDFFWKSFDETAQAFASGHNIDWEAVGVDHVNTEELLLAVAKIPAEEEGAVCPNGGVAFYVWDFEVETVFVIQPAACEAELHAVAELRKRSSQFLLKARDAFNILKR